MSVVFITGITKGIGRKVAELFIENGHRVYGCARSPLLIGGAQQVLSCDVRAPEDLKKCVDFLREAEGKCDVLVNNAGILKDKTLQKMTQDEWADVINTNLSGVHYSVTAFLPLLKESTQGAIVNVSSVVGLRGAFGQANYSAAKAGLIGYSRSCALEFARHGIRVNTVIPGYIDTGMVQSMPEAVQQAILSRVPLGRFGSPSEVAEVIYFLSSGKSSFITGASFEVSGGLQ